MNSYDVGYLLGYMQAMKWASRQKTLESVQPRQVAKQQYTTYEACFISLQVDDFRDGFIDGVEASLKGEKIALEEVAHV